MKFIVIEISIIVLGVICFFASSSILDSFESNIIEVEYDNQLSYKLDEGKYYIYLNDSIRFENYNQSETQGIITTDISIVGFNWRESLSISSNGEIIDLKPELYQGIDNKLFGGYLYASFEVENEADYETHIITTNMDGKSATYEPDFNLTSVNPKIANSFIWIQDNIALVTLAAMFISGMIYVSIPDKKRSNAS